VKLVILMAKRKTVVGVSWRRLQATPSPSGVHFNTPSGRTLRSTSNSVITNVQANVMERMTSFRSTLDTLRKVNVKLKRSHNEPPYGCS